MSERTKERVTHVAEEFPVAEYIQDEIEARGIPKQVMSDALKYFCGWSDIQLDLFWDGQLTICVSKSEQLTRLLGPYSDATMWARMDMSYRKFLVRHPEYKKA